MLKHFLNTKGETLLETTISVVLMTTALFAGIGLILPSIRATQVAKERIIATNLARECVEGVRSIRDTNWLQFSSSPRVCWNHDVGQNIACNDVDNDGTTDDPLQAGTYRIDFLPENSALDPDYIWRLDNTPDAIDWENNTLFLEDGIYTYRSTNQIGSANNRTIFARRVTLDYVTDALTPGGVDDNRLNVTCEVRYLHNNAEERIVTLATRLSDYLGRTNHTD